MVLKETHKPGGWMAGRSKNDVMINTAPYKQYKLLGAY